MIRYNIQNRSVTSIKANSVTEGESIEQKMDRVINNNEPISDGAPIIYSERKEGVIPDYDIRTDRWDIAIDAMTTIAKSKIAKREEKIKTTGKTEEIRGTEQAEKPA